MTAATEIEAKARALYDTWVSTSWAGEAPAPAWEGAPELIRASCRRVILEDMIASSWPKFEGDIS